MKISPSILACDFSILKEDIDTVVKESDYLHIDVMDGNFVNNITFGPGLVNDIRKHFDITFDVHLMISRPLNYVEEFCKSGADIITFHYEAESDITETIKKIKSYSKKVGLSIKPSTDISVLEPFLQELDLVLIMSVEPGFGGQKFDIDSLVKISKLNNIKKEKKYHYEIEVDGGINEETAKLVKTAGADVVVAGTYIFKSEDRTKAIKSLK